ncbi:twin-arginine translocase TatA/TatE family subunit [Cryobacterium frigoriphilum]|uniref:Sec-independent protein translocase protein TatA n=1 Tax=Cryobacterium frigoriphilum TaxID=1259150 RepID=A0A4R9A451_9MICO|nr:twin-arginine translocase TatA/TatE family subunit [Cryobacterium frigoriphilum]TFD51574.1 twin-arginine translocase TatA/TatE family subunit [Cryobacterium frigoriphilum]
MLNNLTGWHFLVILVVVLLLFGAPKLPGLARSLGQSLKIFKSEIKSDQPAAGTNADTNLDATNNNSAAGTVDPTTKP